MALQYCTEPYKFWLGTIARWRSPRLQKSAFNHFLVTCPKFANIAMCAVVEPKWLQYECGHFALRDNLPWWIDYCMYEYCAHSPLHDTPCRDCAQTCNQEIFISSNIIMSGGINRCTYCEHARRLALHKRRKRIQGCK